MKNKSGLTIVELLIAIVVIAILAAISIVAYNGIQQRAKVTAVKSDIGYVLRQIGLYKVENSKYPTSSDEYRIFLKKIGMWDSTRLRDTALGLCSTGDRAILVPTPHRYASWADGTEFYYGEAGEGLRTLIYDTSADPSTGLGRVCAQVGFSTSDSVYFERWSYILTDE